MPVKLTKIIATLGPATGEKQKIMELVQAGVNVFRLNLSHGDHDVCRQWIRWIRETEKELDCFVGILLDLQGPKIRVGKFEGGMINLHHGDRVILTTRKVMGNEKLVPVQLRSFHKDVAVGSHVYLDDGNLCVEVKKISGQDVEVEVQVGGRLSNFKGLNMPDANVSAAALTSKDKQDLFFGLQEGVDFVALSFVGSARDIHQLRKLMRQTGKSADIVAKIERKNAIQNLSEIVQASDAVMVARGDLGIEIPITEVPVVQQQIMRECTLHAKPVIVATQMLESMIANRRPTRAEVSDIANAVMACADAIMLSAETAMGKHPKAAVEIMRETALKTEAYQRVHQRVVPWKWFFKKDPPVDLGITYSANRMVELLNAQALLVFTLTGGTARLVASPNPMVPIYSFSPNVQAARRLTLLRGAVSFSMPHATDTFADLSNVFAVLKKRRLVKKGDRVVMTAGVKIGVPRGTNIIRVEVVT